ncbi:unnamed protein product [Schistocephalus solidus]|uniref:Leucine-rich repeat protein n=1 Tax=Schistocephalus solidus TaxID=70667 RepID=A0A0X3PGH0_SCHSO|nr:unnamed protein product [Schistocephalus solidus]
MDIKSLSLCLFCLTSLIRADPICNCSSDSGNLDYACTCSGAEVRDLSSLFSSGLCANGTPSKLVLKDMPNLFRLDAGFEAPASSGCVGWSSLTVLKLHQTGLQNITSTTFRGLHDLEFLDLSNNSQIVSYREEVFRSVGSTLVDLVATDNRVHSLTRRVFSGLKRLRRLRLSRNKIGYIAAEVFSSDCCSELTELRLDYNILTDLEDETFRGLTSLRLLDLRGNPLQRLSSHLFKPFAATITHLWMSHDDNANFGGFGELPKGLFLQMNSLRVLEIAELKLRNLSSDSFEGLSSLEELSLRGNRLTEIPSNIFSSLHSLERLDLSANFLVCLPDASSERYQRLRWLDISWNGLTHLTRNGFVGLASSPPTNEYLRFVLNISSNPIQRIEPDAFCGLGGPVELIVSSPNATVPTTQDTKVWNTMENWPENPFALVGNMSIIRGMLKNSASSSAPMTFATAEPVYGRDDSLQACSQTSQGAMLLNRLLESKLYKQVTYTAKDVNTSLASGCPWLALSKLSEWQLSKLGVPGLSGTPNAMSDSHLGSGLEQGSRLYLLIIVAVCVTFLLSALTIIMCYRAWSRRATQKLALDLEANGAGIMANGHEENVSEKHELLARVQSMTNGREALGQLPEGSESTTANGASLSSRISEDGVPRDDKTSSKRTLNADEETRRHSRSTRINTEPKAGDLEQMTSLGIL